MSKRVRILVAPTCVSVMLSAVVPVFAKNDQETLGVQLAMEYLLSQDASDNVKVSFRMDGTAESTEELTAIGEKLADRISQVLLKERSPISQVSIRIRRADFGLITGTMRVLAAALDVCLIRQIMG